MMCACTKDYFITVGQINMNKKINSARQTWLLAIK